MGKAGGLRRSSRAPRARGTLCPGPATQGPSSQPPRAQQPKPRDALAQRLPWGAFSGHSWATWGRGPKGPPETAGQQRQKLSPRENFVQLRARGNSSRPPGSEKRLVLPCGRGPHLPHPHCSSRNLLLVLGRRQRSRVGHAPRTPHPVAQTPGRCPPAQELPGSPDGTAKGAPPGQLQRPGHSDCARPPEVLGPPAPSFTRLYLYCWQHNCVFELFQKNSK